MTASEYAPFDIVVVPFPYSDRLAEKRRPALIVSAAAMMKRYGLVWLAMITSAANPRWDCDVPIADLRSAALPAASMVRPVKIATAELSRVVRRVGRLGPADAKAVKAALGEILAA